MKRLLIVVVMAAVFALALAGCAGNGTAEQTVSGNEAETKRTFQGNGTETGQTVTGSGTKTERPIPAETPEPETLAVIAESADKTVSVLAASPAPENGMFDGMTVRIGEQSKRFEWKNVTNPTYFPRVWTVNLDADPDEETVIVLTTGYGTGVYENRIHVLKRDFREIPVEDAIAKVRELAVTRAQTGPDSRKFSLELGGEMHTFTYDEDGAGFWFDDIVFGNAIDYKVEDGTIVAEVSVQVSPGEFPGIVVCPYAGRDGKLEVSGAKFVSY